MGNIGRVLDLLRKRPYTPAVKPGRLQLIVALVLALELLTAPLAAEAQQVARQVKIGVLCAGPCPFPLETRKSSSLIIALERVGLVPGRTLAWDTGGIMSSTDQIAVEAQKLV